MTIATAWGVTAAEQDRTYPCDALVPEPARRLFRGVDVAAPPDVVFRWVCQFRVAPYSYDWIDNAGRRSPRVPVPWTWDLEVGQTFSRIFALVSFVPGEHLTVRMNPDGTRWFGDVAVTYAVVPAGPARSRLVAVLRTPEPTSRTGAAGAWLLAWGDLVMMRKQLLTFAALAEADPQPSV
ncbi:SRPBCC family protein [uncultured Cellulomonas sp.]|uniref:SRPBCC family protein n=1 Tax=uncultured Cellulomonas sp. TaxID=189682 RepID=UPI0028E4E8C4|nr:SRPBCC family protein [uncultured Cellulomonas sp.]